jgi:hypothetical protein
MRATIDMCRTPTATFLGEGAGAGAGAGGGGDALTTAAPVDLGPGDWETILQHATINNYEYAPRRWADHGLVCEFLGGVQ